MKRNAHNVEKYLIEGNEVNSGEKLHFHHLMDKSQLLELANCEKLGLDHEFLLEKKGRLILLSSKYEFLRPLPKEGEAMIIDTWSRGIDVVKLFREAKYYCDGINEENVFALNTSQWAIISEEDHKTVELSRWISQEAQEDFFDDSIALTEELDLLESFYEEGMEPVLCYKVRYSDLDINIHFHSSYYIRTAMDAFAEFRNLDPEKETIRIRSFHIQYQNEIFMGDSVSMFVKEEEDFIFMEGVDPKGECVFLVKAKMDILDKDLD